MMQELESAGVELPMGDYSEVYEIIEAVREDLEAPLPESLGGRVVQDPALVDFSGVQPLTVNVMPAEMLVHISTEGIIMDFFDSSENDGDADATVGMTFEEWREFADWVPTKS
jgi:hypothetical protein